MDARMNQADFAGMAPFGRPRDAVLAQELRLAAAHAQDTAISRGLGRVVETVVGVFASIAAIPARMRVEAELRSLTDRELADIGLTRGEITGIARR